MSRPQNKTQLLELSQENFQNLNNYIDSFSIEEQNRDFPEGTMNRNIRDVIAHLHHWHIMFLDWYEKGMSGKKPDMPAKGYTWKTTPELNKEIWVLYQTHSLVSVRKLFQESFDKIQLIITHHSNEELFEKKKFSWTGSTSLGSYLVSATSSHYDWALKLIKKVKK